ncbi:hypothetical protein HS371_85 [Klebsiella phage vB_KpP_HS37]|nr:hypothetical protein HS371_85 [Klebsiella phage vB_KpP_HS37]
MAPDLRDLFPNVPQYHLNLLDVLLKTSKSGNPLRVYHQDRRHGKSWILRWLKENEPLLKKLSERSSVQHQRTTKAGTSTSARKSKRSTSGGNRYEFIIFDELVDENEKTQLLNAKN